MRWIVSVYPILRFGSTPSSYPYVSRQAGRLDEERKELEL